LAEDSGKKSRELVRECQINENANSQLKRKMIKSPGIVKKTA
jgi:hypothetical protein